MSCVITDGGRVITNPISNIPKNPKSHSLGWTKGWAHHLTADIAHVCDESILDYNTVYLDYGANFSGKLNLFGGVNKDVYDRLNILMRCNHIRVLDWESMNFGNEFVSRIGKPSTYEEVNESWCRALREKFLGVETFTQEMLNLDSVMVGDSHSTAFANEEDMVFRTDGQTLYGALNNGLSKLMRGCKPRKISFCLGSIDIRHHLLRHGASDRNSMVNLISEYVKAGDKIGSFNNSEVSYAGPVPVEHEERRIPKTGYYKKTPFFGTLKQRQDLTELFIEVLEATAPGRVILPPSDWYTMDPAEYAKTFMEFGGSFHIAPPYYRRNEKGVSENA